MLKKKSGAKKDRIPPHLKMEMNSARLALEDLYARTEEKLSVFKKEFIPVKESDSVYKEEYVNRINDLLDSYDSIIKGLKKKDISKLDDYFQVMQKS
ncbi:MAG: hypothetical protein ACLFQV_12920, partial [Vulcanimicrobiota bacterium]